MTVKGRVAVVTGAEQGLGHEIARQLSGMGASVYVTARDVARAERVAAEFRAAGGDAVAGVIDVTDQATIDAFAERLAADPGRVDIIVNNAGILLDEAAETGLRADLDQVRRTLETNFFGAWRLVKALVPLMRSANYGRIVNISSTMGQLETMGFDSPGYRISKAALNALTAMLAAELADTNILVNAAEPGWTRTELGGPDAPRSVEQGAATPIWLATLPDGAMTGGFFFDRRLIPW